jgi:Ni/Fe-hydrogenase 1 B-type cytochrome subunit
VSDILSPEHHPSAAKSLYIWEAPVRAWHAVNGVAILVLAVTGWLIGNPPAAIGGEASEHFVMGNLRFVHLVAAHVFAIGMVVRIYWAIAGNSYSRQLFVLPVWRASWWEDFFYRVRYYGFLTKETRIEAGHNALAQLTYFGFNVVLAFVLIATGYAMHGQQLGDGSWADSLFGWVVPALGNSQEVRMWHYASMWLMVAFVIVHVYMAVRADLVGRQSSVGSMVSGWRTYWRKGR